MHTVVAADAAGRPIRVVCDYCRSEHNYRGGPRIDRGESSPAEAVASPVRDRRAPAGAEAFPIIGERERTMSAMSIESDTSGPRGSGLQDVELLLRRIIREETGLTAVVPADKWRGGTMVLRPGREGLQEKSWPIETFFHKVVMLRNRLRTLEQQLNASDLPDDVKVKLQAYITGCYGSLTTFNVLFAEEEDQFRGSGGND
jgi:hypothetical protein